MKFNPVPYHPVDPIDVQLAKTIGDTLENHYPGWGWMVHVDSEGGVINIINSVMNASLQKQYGYVLKFATLNGTHEHIVKQAVRAGGELLERMNLPRSRWRGQEPDRVEGAEFKHQPLEYQHKELRRLLGIA